MDGELSPYGSIFDLVSVRLSGTGYISNFTPCAKGRLVP
jgi:hypothetical protein